MSERILYQADVEFRWPPALPYGGTFRGKDAAVWSATGTHYNRRGGTEDGSAVIGVRRESSGVLYPSRG